MAEERGAFIAAGQRAAMALTTQIVKAAYEEAMREHGLLPFTVALISGCAERKLAALDEVPDGPPASSGVRAPLG